MLIRVYVRILLTRAYICFNQDQKDCKRFVGVMVASDPWPDPGSVAIIGGQLNQIRFLPDYCCSCSMRLIPLNQHDFDFDGAASRLCCFTLANIGPVSHHISSTTVLVALSPSLPSLSARLESAL